MAIEITIGPARRLVAAGRIFSGERAAVRVECAAAPRALYLLGDRREPVAACLEFAADGEGAWTGAVETATRQVAALVDGVRAGKALLLVAALEAADGSQLALGTVSMVASAMPEELEDLPPDIIDPFVRRAEFDSAMGAKADKVEGATAGDFAALDESGNLLDSGKKPSDFATADNIALEAAALSAWDLSPLPAAIQGGTPNIVSPPAGYYQWRIGTFGAYSEEHFPTEAAAQAATAITISGPDCPTSTGITRAVAAYRLGPDAAANPNRDKPLAPADAMTVAAAAQTAAGMAQSWISSSGQPHVGNNSIHVSSFDRTYWNGKQDAISDLAAIRAGAAAGATAVQPGQRNLLDYTTGTTLSPSTAVYRSALNSDGTFPAITDTAIPTAAAYYQFELELAVPSTVPSTITGPTGWTWIDGLGLPDPADLSGGETIFVSVRLDCWARTFLASVWRVE